MPLSGLGVENKKSATTVATTHHTPHHYTTMANRKTLRSGEAQSKEGEEKRLQQSEREISFGAFLQRQRSSTSFPVSTFLPWLPTHCGLSWQIGGKKVF